MNKQESHIITGISRDLSPSHFNSKLAYDAQNIRITTREGNQSLLSVTNERGTKLIENFKDAQGHSILGRPVIGIPIGHAVLNDYLVLFTTIDNTDRIYRIEFKTGTCITMFQGNLGFSPRHPIETLPFYENEDIQKVYWVDGINQPRVINIAGKNPQFKPTMADIFNFSRNVELKHSISVRKRNTGGLFSAGTVQYAFSYYNKFGQESKIFDFTPMYYLSPKERGLQADQTSSCSFFIDLKDLDINYQYVRVYAIVRSSANATPNCRIVGDYPISDNPVPAEIGAMKSVDNPTERTVGFENLYIYNKRDYTLTKLEDYSEPYGGNSDEESYKITLQEGEYLVDNVQNIAYQASHEMRIDHFYNDGSYIIEVKDSEVAKGDMNGYLFAGSYTPGTQRREVTLVDNGSYGSTIDASALLFAGGENIVASTIAQKDNTLFLGNIKLNKPNIGQLALPNGILLKDYTKCASSRKEITPVKLDYYGRLSTDYGANKYNPSKNDYYNYSIDNNRSSQQIKRFKSGEVYRLGLMAQYIDGSWSEVLWLGDVENKVVPELTEDGYATGAWEYKLSEDMVKLLIENNFRRVAPVVVYPSLADRNVVCQGIIVPTVYNVGDRATNSPFVQSSWFVRQSDTSSSGGPLRKFRGLHNTSVDDEIQLNLNTRELHGPVIFESEENPYGNPNIKMTAEQPADFINNYSEAFMVDESILTFHSPDIEFNENIGQSEMDGLKVRLVGMSFLEDGKAKYYITLNSIGIADASKIVKGGDWGFAYSILTYEDYYNTINNSSMHPGMFVDGAVNDTGDSVSILSDQDEIYGWCVYPWHRNGSLNNQGRLNTKQASGGYTRTAMLKHKILSRLSYARTAYDVFDTVNLDTRDPQLFNSDQMTAIKIPAPANSGLTNLVYYGNIDKVLTPNYVNLSGKYRANYDEDPTAINTYRFLSTDKTVGYPINYLWFKYLGSDATRKADTWSMASRSEVSLMEQNGGGSTAGTPLSGNTQVVWKDRWTNVDSSSKQFLGKDPVSMKYKSTPHAVIALDYKMEDIQVGDTILSKPVQMILPMANSERFDYKAQPFWDKATQYFEPYKIKFNDKYSNPIGVFIAELYRDDVDGNSRFGGTTDTALASNTWVKCGDAVELNSGSTATIVFKEGDTYLARYDCLKTYPYTNEDTNSIIEIYSTEVETRVNLDERTDRNRGLTDNSAVTRQNFNLFNHAGYEQDSNFFNFQALDYTKVNTLSYPNMITWSLQKSPGEDIDKWTSIDVTSTLDLDGDKGEVISLNILNNELYSFQRRGLAQLLFNSRVQIPTSDGQPIEISNGMKMQGKRYLSSMIGCMNKWSIQETPSGLYFMDDEANTIYRFNGSLEDISTKCGMKSWYDAHNSIDSWNPVDFSNVITFYDRTNSDLYIVAKDWCLVYSEQLGQFTSFMNYEDTPVMACVGDTMYAVKTVNYKTDIWQMFAGDYNSFYGNYKPYSITFIANDNPTMDKVFNNLEFRADMYDDDTFKPLETFDTLKVYNQHQTTGDVKLETLPVGSANLKKKFNVWRINVPRDITPGTDGKPINFGMNRIRSTWAYIKLGCSKEQAKSGHRMQFSDILVDYFV